MATLSTMKQYHSLLPRLASRAALSQSSSIWTSPTMASLAARSDAWTPAGSHRYYYASQSSSSAAGIATATDPRRQPRPTRLQPFDLRRRSQSRTLASSPGVNGKARDTPPHPTSNLTALEYAVVDHAAAYDGAMRGRHGRQLALAEEEGKGRDDTPFDPFSDFAAELENEEGGQDGGEEDREDDEEESPLGDYEAPLTDEDVLEAMENYNADGSVIRPKSELAALRAGAPAGGKFAVIHLAGKQHKVLPDDLLVVNKLRPIADWAVGTRHTVKDADVLLFGSINRTVVGLPGVLGAEVDLMVEEITRDATIIVFKKRRRKNSKRKNGFRREVTFLRVLDIRMADEESAGEGSDHQDEAIAA